jgi:hypothetical protein
MANELKGILTEYANNRPNDPQIVLDNITTETKRLVRGGLLTYRLQRNPPKLAFDGEIGSWLTILSNLGPGREDITKAWRRWRTSGSSG